MLSHIAPREYTHFIETNFHMKTNYSNFAISHQKISDRHHVVIWKEWKDKIIMLLTGPPMGNSINISCYVILIADEWMNERNELFWLWNTVVQLLPFIRHTKRQLLSFERKIKTKNHNFLYWNQVNQQNKQRCEV